MRPVITIVPVERLTHRGERFHCAPLRSTMTADVCLSRRAAKRDTRTGEAAHLYPTCVRCPLGARVEAAVGSTRKVVTCAHEGGCSVVVGPVRRGLRPLCPEHRVAHGTSALVGIEAATAKRVAARAATLAAVVRPSCAVTGCDDLAAHTRVDTLPWAVLCCLACRDVGRRAIRDGNATAETVIAYLSSGPRLRGSAGVAAKRERLHSPRRAPVVDAAAVAAIVEVLRPLSPDDRARVLHAAAVEAARGAR